MNHLICDIHGKGIWYMLGYVAWEFALGETEYGSSVRLGCLLVFHNFIKPVAEFWQLLRGK